MVLSNFRLLGNGRLAYNALNVRPTGSPGSRDVKTMARANFGSRHDARSVCQLLEGPEAKCIARRSGGQKLPHAGRGKHCISQMRLNN
jgi:hypothetical protein